MLGMLLTKYAFCGFISNNGACAVTLLMFAYITNTSKKGILRRLSETGKWLVKLKGVVLVKAYL